MKNTHATPIDCTCKKSARYLIIGLAVVAVYMLPYLIVGQNAYIRIFDNLDSEILFYKLNARHFFNFTGEIPEIMGGLPVGSVNVFSPVQTIIYMVMPAYWAYIFNDFWVRAVGFIGLFLLINRIIGSGKGAYYISFFTSLILALLPVYSVYGLSIYGQPLLAIAVWDLAKNRHLIRSYLLIVFFGVSSSLILTGYYLLAFMGVAAVILTVKQGFKKSLNLWLGLALLTAVFLLTNIKLILMTLDGYTSMRVERIERSLVFMDRLTSTDFLSEVLFLFFVGQVHAASAHIYTYFALVPMAVLAIIKHKNKTLQSDDKKYLNIIKLLIIYNFVCALINGLYFTPLLGFFTERLSFLRGFQFQRMFLSYTITWSVAFALSVHLLHRWGVFYAIARAAKSKTKTLFNKKQLDAADVKQPDAVSIRQSGGRPRALKVIAIAAAVAAAFFVSGVYEAIVPVSSYYQTVARVFTGGDKIVEGYPTYKQFTEKPLFDEIKEYLQDGPTDYKVASLGMHPAIASLNGLNTVDGFFQNYPLEYKHKFRTVIDGELKKDSFLQEYFDYWGNKCYLLSSEAVLDYTISKQAGKIINELSINTGALKGQIGCDYILSAVQIANSDALNLELLRMFDRQGSYFAIYLYKLI